MLKIKLFEEADFVRMDMPYIAFRTVLWGLTVASKADVSELIEKAWLTLGDDRYPSPTAMKADCERIRDTMISILKKRNEFKNRSTNST